MNLLPNTPQDCFAFLERLKPNPEVLAHQNANDITPNYAILSYMLEVFFPPYFAQKRWTNVPEDSSAPEYIIQKALNDYITQQVASYKALYRTPTLVAEEALEDEILAQFSFTS